MFNTDRFIGQQFGKYQIQSLLGTGGMGAVFRARHVDLDKTVAVKVLPPNGLLDDESVQRFRREAQTAAKLEHPNVVSITDFGREGDVFYLVMRYIKGESLADRLQRQRKLKVEHAVTIMVEVAKGLERAHEAGLVHRDIKPANILLSMRGEVLIADFGLAKQAGENQRGLTATGMILGTPDYMAPEQCEGLSSMDGRADIYSLGLVFYTMITGEVPSEGSTPLQIIMNRVKKDVTPPKELEPSLSQAVNDLIMRCLERDPEARMASSSKLLEALEALPEYGGSKATRKLPKPPAIIENKSPINIVAAPNDPTVVVGVEEPVQGGPTKPLKARPLSRSVGVEVKVKSRASNRDQDDEPAPASLKARPVSMSPHSPAPRDPNNHPPRRPGPPQRPPRTVLEKLLMFFGLVFLTCCFLTMLAAAVGK